MLDSTTCVCEQRQESSGDSASGKSKLVERFLLDDYNPRQLSTYAVNLFRYTTATEGSVISWRSGGVLATILQMDGNGR